jgi:hypothetical protein
MKLTTFAAIDPIETVTTSLPTNQFCIIVEEKEYDYALQHWSRPREKGTLVRILGGLINLY